MGLFYRPHRLFYLFLSFFTLFLISSCATVVNDRIEILPVRTIPEGAVAEAGGLSCKTPCSLQLVRGQSYKLAIRKEGHKTEEVLIDGSSWDAALWANVLWFGFAPIGVIVDFLYGSAYDFEPEEIVRSLDKLDNNLVMP